MSPLWSSRDGKIPQTHLPTMTADACTELKMGRSPVNPIRPPNSSNFEPFKPPIFP